MKIVKQAIRAWMEKLGYEVKRVSQAPVYPPHTSKEEIEIIELAQPYTMVSTERLLNVIRTVQYLETHKIPGAIVECGVWRGGCVLAAMETLRRLGSFTREIYLYDTFEGMTQPGQHDEDILGRRASELYTKFGGTGAGGSDWCQASLEEVRAAIGKIDYPADKVHFVKGRVEDTIPGVLPGSIALLRLDTDWYEATRHELNHLHPHLVPGGVLIVDDYGFWKGSRQAVDEYFARVKETYYSHWIDTAGRVYVRTADVGA